MHRFASLIAILAAALLVNGCASSNRDVMLSELLKDLEAKESVSKAPSAAGPDAPDAPVSKLPPAPSARSAGEPASRSEDITIQPDSLLQISVAEDPGLDGSYHVNDIGAVELGYVGPVILFNKTEREAEKKIREVLKSRDFRNATVKVRILRASYDSVAVSGAVTKPGLIRIGSGDTISLNDALLRAGGLRPSATGAKVRIVRGGLLSAVASSLEGEEYSLVSDDGKPTVPDVTLRNNDVIFVFSSATRVGVEVGEKEILVLGEVSKPGVYRFTQSEPCTIMHLIFKMGGLPPYANKKAIKIIRRGEEGKEKETKVNVDKILENGKPEDDIPLENGDRIIVPARRLSLF
jgi:polysaccharide biosynthesis/export protein